MPAFSVDPDSVSGAGNSVAGFGDEVRTQLRTLSAHTGAADGTPAAEAYAGLLDHFGAVMPQFAAAHDAYSAAMARAASLYAETDQVVKGAADEGVPTKADS
jgi:hypothetical protein